MSNKRKSRSNMKQIYMIRRLVAVLILIFIVVAIFTKCSGGRDATTQGQNETNTTNNTVSVPNENVTQPVESNIIGSEDNTNTTESPDTTDTQDTTEMDANLLETIQSNEEALQNEYDEYADVNYEDSNKFYFNLKGETRELVLDKDDSANTEEFEAFWEEFKGNLIKSSETLAETVQPGMELHVLNPRDDTNTILLIQDGSEIYDSTSN